MVPHSREIYEKFKAQDLDDDHLTFKINENEGHWHITWRKSFAHAYPWLMGSY